MAKEYTPKQIEKYKRQKYLSVINKCTKNLFKLFRDSSTNYEKFKNRFIILKKELEEFSDIRVDSEHSKKAKEYIEELYSKTVLNQNFAESNFLDIKNGELSKLNRLQKLKNRTKYTKDKHKENFF